MVCVLEYLSYGAAARAHVTHVSAEILKTLCRSLYTLKSHEYWLFEKFSWGMRALSLCIYLSPSLSLSKNFIGGHVGSDGAETPRGGLRC